MVINNYIKPDQKKPSAAVAISGAAPQTTGGPTLPMGSIATGSLSAKLISKLTTNTITIVGKWQISYDAGSTWVDCSGAPNAPANVTIQTGTGSGVTQTIVIPAPACVYGAFYCRFATVSGTASGGGAGVDEVTISYNWREIILAAN